jgi:hypothetical protein
VSLQRPSVTGYSRRTRLRSTTPQPAVARAGSMCSARVSAISEGLLRRRLCRLYVNRQSEACRADLVLQRQPDELRLALSKRLGEASRPFRTDRSSPLLDVAKVRPRNAKQSGKFRQALRFSLPQSRKGDTECQRSSHQGFEIPRRFSPSRSLHCPSNHVC